MSRSRELLSSTPLSTLVFMTLNIGIFLILQLVLDLDLNHFTMSPRKVVQQHEFYRIITSCIFHVNLMHIGMNMLSTFAVSSSVEKRLGTVTHFLSTLWAMLLTGIIYISIAYLWMLLSGRKDLILRQSVGFSGILFHMSVLECNLSPTTSRSVFGVVNVPTKLYPWALLIILQFIMPNLSLLGHLSGILTGTLEYYGVLTCIFPGEAYLHSFEASPRWQWLVHRSNFVATPTGSASIQREPTGLWQALCHGVAFLFKCIRDVIEAISVCIFGRGHRLNSNISLGRFWPTRSRTSDDGSENGHRLGSGVGEMEVFLEEQDDWVGLPPSSEATSERQEQDASHLV